MGLPLLAPGAGGQAADPVGRATPLSSLRGASLGRERSAGLHPGRVVFGQRLL